MSYGNETLHETQYPDAGVTAVAGLRCDDCDEPMEEYDRWDYLTDTQDFMCPKCGKVTGLIGPGSWDIQ